MGVSEVPGSVVVAVNGERRVERKFVAGSKGPIGGRENLARRDWA